MKYPSGPRGTSEVGWQTLNTPILRRLRDKFFKNKVFQEMSPSKNTRSTTSEVENQTQDRSRKLKNNLKIYSFELIFKINKNV